MPSAELRDLLGGHDYKVAQVCARLGWRVLPFSYRDGEKRPMIARWPERATADLDVVDEWWGWAGSPHFHHHVGVATGRESGVWVLDVDAKRGADGRATLRRLLAEHGETSLPITLTIRTPSGGEHRYWPYPTDGREIKNSASGVLGPGLDVRGWHGFVAAPLTRTRRGTYEVIDGTWPETPAPRWLEDLVERRRPERDHWVAGTHGSGLDYETWAAEAEHVGPGGQEDYLFRGLSSMRARNVDPGEMVRLGWEAASRFACARPGEPWTEQHVVDKVAHVVDAYEAGVSADELAALAHNFYRTAGGPYR